MKEKDINTVIELTEKSYRDFENKVDTLLPNENKLLACGLLYLMNNQIAIMQMLKDISSESEVQK